MANKYGFASVNQQIQTNTQPQSNLIDKIEELRQNVISARVLDIILDDQHPNFESNGGWAGIGTIFFDNIELSSNVKSNLTASPLLPYLKNYPLVNEFVLLFKLPNKQVGQNSNITEYYYLNPIAIWNNQHLNAYPNLEGSSQTQPSQQKSYQAIEQGQTRKSTDEELNYDYNSPLVGGTFIERSNIHPLLAFAGDVITEGRWGNSIRFGSTVKSKSILYGNNWSDTGENGNPITIIRNGQPEDSSNAGYLPIIENINEDLSSIYLTSNQTIPLETTITNNPSIKDNQPQSLGSYEESQILLNSNRLVFNSKMDSILINSEKSISLTSINSIGIYSQEGDITLQSSKNSIRLGDSGASESLILGDTFINDFKILLNKFQILCQTLEAEPYLTLSSTAASSVKSQVNVMLTDINNYTSKVVKSI